MLVSTRHLKYACILEWQYDIGDWWMDFTFHWIISSVPTRLKWNRSWKRIYSLSITCNQCTRPVELSQSTWRFSTLTAHTRSTVSAGLSWSNQKYRFLLQSAYFWMTSLETDYKILLSSASPSFETRYSMRWLPVVFFLLMKEHHHHHRSKQKHNRTCDGESRVMPDTTTWLSSPSTRIACP